MVWLARIAIAYVCFMLLAIGLMQWLARVDRQKDFGFETTDGSYRFEVYRDIVLPAYFGGRGTAPSEVEVLDRRGRVIDGEHLDDVKSIYDVRWGRSEVDFFYRRDGPTYRSTIELEQ